jgi:hypothetical protein
MRTTAILGIAGSLSIAFGMPRAARGSEPAGRAKSRVVVSVSASTGGAPARGFRASSSTAGTAHVEAASAAAPVATAAFDKLLLLRFQPTWSTIAGHTHAGFSMSGRF